MRETAAHFEIPGRFAQADPYGRGHIHDTYRLHFEDAGRSARYILQRINTRVFRDPAALMDNLSRICSNQRRELARERVPDPERRHLRLVPTTDGGSHWIDPEGGHWRCFHFLEGTRSIERVETERQAHEAARAFGCFAARMTRFEGPPLAITIPDFHDLDRRYAALEAAIQRDSHGRAKAVQRECERAASWYESLQRSLREVGAERLPVRIVHNDCKVDNALLDAETGEGLCAIDLDTVMDGTVLADFGELLRTASCPAPEDEAERAGMSIELAFVRGVARGYLSAMGEILSPQELDALPLAGARMAFENAIRFLTDHLSGDVYFRTQRDAQNLDRARAQLRRVELLAAQGDAIRGIVESARRELPGGAR